jgi:Domain of unknown function (DUF543)
MESSSPSSSSSSKAAAAAQQQQQQQQQAAVIITSDRVVSETIRNGMKSIAWKTGAGLVMGGLAGVVLFRGGRSGGAAGRKIFAGLGAGIGLGSAWTRTSMNLEQVLLGEEAAAGAAGKK